MGTIIAILVLFVLCGFIAYVGDLLGRRFGKKRLSLFGLRPKHTAVILTVTTGVVIAGVTFGAALATMPWFRDVVRHGERLARQNRRLEQENLRLQQETRKRLEENQRVAAENRTLLDENRKLASANQQLAARNRTLQTQNRSLRATSEALEQYNQELRGENQKLAAANRQLAARNQELEVRRKELDQQLVALREDLDAVREERDRYQVERYTFRRGYVIEQRVIPPNPPPDVLRATVENILFEADQQARQTDPSLADVESACKLLPPAEMEDTGDPSTAEVRRWALAEASRIQGAILLRAVVARNTVEGQPVPIRIECYPNEIVFRKGDVITACEVDGTLTTGLILGRLVTFLQSDVRRTATMPPYRMVPREGELGEVMWDRLIQLCDEIRAANGLVRVLARARHDTPRSGPLYVDLEVEPMLPRLPGAG